MKTINDSEIIFLVQESDEGGYEAKALGHSIFTEAEDLDELRKNIKESVICHFDKWEVPAVVGVITNNNYDMIHTTP